MNRLSLPRHMLTRLTVLTCLVLLGAIVLNAAFTYRVQSDIVRASSEQQALAMARTLAYASVDHLVTNQIDSLDELLLASIDFQDVLELRVSDTEGRVLSHFRRKGRLAPIRIFDASTTVLPLPSQLGAQTLQERIEGKQRLVAWHPVKSGETLGWVRVDLSTDAIEVLSQTILVSTIKAGGLAAFLGGLLLYVFLRSPIRSLERARQFALSLDRADGAQLPHSDAPVEIEDLERALNGASTDLHRNRIELAYTIEQLRLNEAVLTNNNQQLEVIFTLSPDGLITFNADGKLDYANPAFLQMSGWLNTELKGLDVDAFDRKLRDACASDAPFPGTDALEELNASKTNTAEQRQLITLEGQQKRVLEVKKRTAHGDAVSHILYFRDITYEAEVDRVKSEFLSHAAHELRTPMTSIFGYSEMLLAMEFDPQTQRELLDIIHRQTAALVKIIDELLDLARIDARGTLDFHMQTLDLLDLTQKTIADLNFDADKWPVHISAQLADITAIADQAKIRQALINVLGNAQKYSPQGGPIQVSFLRENDLVGIRICDHGLGLTPEQLKHIGQRFWRADISGNVPGTGLGVGIVKEILELHGGRLQVESSYGQGSTFTLWLPKGPHASAAQASQQ